jgi:hypothetical protein
MLLQYHSTHAPPAPAAQLHVMKLAGTQCAPLLLLLLLVSTTASAGCCWCCWRGRSVLLLLLLHVCSGVVAQRLSNAEQCSQQQVQALNPAHDIFSICFQL